MNNDYHGIKVPTLETCELLHQSGYGRCTALVWMYAREENTGAPYYAVTTCPPDDYEPTEEHIAESGRQDDYWVSTWRQDWNSIRPCPTADELLDRLSREFEGPVAVIRIGSQDGACWQASAWTKMVISPENPAEALALLWIALATDKATSWKIGDKDSETVSKSAP